jgi:hypothetical protein
VYRERINASAVGADAPLMIGSQQVSKERPEPQGQSLMLSLFGVMPRRARLEGTIRAKNDRFMMQPARRHSRGPREPG